MGNGFDSFNNGGERDLYNPTNASDATPFFYQGFYHAVCCGFAGFVIINELLMFITGVTQIFLFAVFLKPFFDAGVGTILTIHDSR